jgi:hypothetical protein
MSKASSLKTALLLTALMLLTHAEQATAQTGSATRSAGCPSEFVILHEGECTFAIGNWTYKLTTNGKLVRRKDGSAQDLQLFFVDNFVGAVQIAEYGGDIILIYGVEYGDGGAGKVSRLGNDPFEVKWILHVPAFNLSTGLLRSLYLYQAGFGFVSKIDLDKGQYLWKHDDLYRFRSYPPSGPYAFGRFEVPELAQGFVHFPDRPSKPRDSVFVIRVDDESGEMFIDEPGSGGAQ